MGGDRGPGRCRGNPGVLAPTPDGPRMMGQARVLFLPQGKEAWVPVGSTLLSAASSVGLALQNICGGEGICGRCRVMVREGQVETSPTLLLSPEEVKAGYVLACQAKVQGDVVVEVPRESLLERPTPDLDAREFLAPEAQALFFRLDPLVQKIFLPLPLPSLEDNLGDQERVFREIRRVMDAPILQAGLKVLRALPETLRRANFQVTATLARRGGTVELLEVEEGNKSQEAYGVAVDVGTSTVVAHLLHLPSGRALEAEAKYNSQRVFGAEVTRRIIASEREGPEKLQALVVEDINDLISLMVERSGVRLADVVAVMCAGNTAMTHFLLGLPAGALRKNPYVAAALRPPPVRAAEVGIRINPRGLLYTMPGIGGWVGGDITAGILASGIHRAQEPVLFVDIGTNGEIVVACRDWMVAASASAGPAFEGTGVTCGMRASRGAITKVRFTPNGVFYETVGNAPAKGLCGSGLIDALAEMFRAGYLDRAGRLTRGVVDHQGEPAFLLLPKGQAERDILITQRDIDNLLRAKAAIFAGISVLLRETGLTVKDLAQVYIAGAFGSHLDPGNAVALGLVPDVALERIRFLGNTSLAGAKLALLSRRAMEEAQSIAERVTYYDLASCPYYYQEFLAAKFLPHTDLSRFPRVAQLWKGPGEG
ncbi:MAG: ASKHA domain-containing protein [Candidatus Bipolaricaulaceae bacterium]